MIMLRLAGMIHALLPVMFIVLYKLSLIMTNTLLNVYCAVASVVSGPVYGQLADERLLNNKVQMAV